MGIQGLLPFIKNSIDNSYHIEKFRGKRVAVDGYAWLHKASYGCCEELCTGTPTKKWIDYCVRLIDMLLFFQIEVTMVFDGADLPAKKATEIERAKNRKTNLEKGMELKSRGDREGSRMYFSRAVNVTPYMAAQLIHYLKMNRQSVKCIVAPYEADAQLAYLSINNIVDVIIAEDSDTIPFGCKEIVFKLEQNGKCERLLLSNIYQLCTKGVDLTNFTHDMIVSMCIGAGCDYLDSLKNIGIKNSYKYVSKHRSVDKVLRTMRLHGLLPLSVVKTINLGDEKISVLEYEVNFYKAFLTFHHQVVYDVVTQRTRFLNPINFNELPQSICPPSGSASETDVAFLGLILDPLLASSIANGLVDPISHKAFTFEDSKNQNISYNRYHDKIVHPKADKVVKNQLRYGIMNHFSVKSSIENKVNAVYNNDNKTEEVFKLSMVSTKQPLNTHSVVSANKISSFFKKKSISPVESLAKLNLIKKQEALNRIEKENENREITPSITDSSLHNVTIEHKNIVHRPAAPSPDFNTFIYSGDSSPLSDAKINIKRTVDSDVVTADLDENFQNKKQTTIDKQIGKTLYLQAFQYHS